jgi:glycerol-3-phosphate dehydrogenase
MNDHSQKDTNNPVDLLIVGGGINGCAIARDAAGRGLNVVLCEMNDIASATSSWSSKLIHGGLRYLENFEFKLVREALNEREVLMRSAPFLIHPLKFVLPYEKHLRSPWMLRTGLFLYDHLGKRTTIPGSKKESFIPSAGNALKDNFSFGFSYYDCQTDDARLTVLCARDAYEQGATISTHTECTTLSHDKQLWTATLKDRLTTETSTLQARTVINAGGPWVDDINHRIASIDTKSSTQLVQGSHFIVPKLYDGYHAYILQNEDGRIVFAIPYLNEFTLIGTTDTKYSGDPGKPHITDDEINYLCNIINKYFHHQISKSDIVWSYSGVRALYNNDAKDPSKTTREYHLEVHDKDTPPYISVFGGKITTCRVLADDACHLLKKYFPHQKESWTTDALLPGGNLNSSWDQFLSNLASQYSWLPESLRYRYARAYGSNIHSLIGDAQSLEDLGTHFGADLYEHEVLYWIQNEWAQFSDDMLWRRSKRGLFLSDNEKQKLKDYIQE